MYADDNSDHVPPNNAWDTTRGYEYNSNQTWVRGWLELKAQAPSDNTNEVFLQSGHLARYQPSLGVWKCPGDKSASIHGGRLYPRVRSVTMNGFIAADAWSNHPRLQVVWRMSDAVNPAPSGLFVFTDTTAEIISTGFFGFSGLGMDPIDPKQFKWTMVPASYHNRAGSLSFADGHAEIHPWKDAPTWNHDAFFGQKASSNNCDILWMIQHATGQK